jgi:hypothetical protein
LDGNDIDKEISLLKNNLIELIIIKDTLRIELSRSSIHPTTTTTTTPDDNEKLQQLENDFKFNENQINDLKYQLILLNLDKQKLYYQKKYFLYTLFPFTFKSLFNSYLNNPIHFLHNSTIDFIKIDPFVHLKINSFIQFCSIIIDDEIIKSYFLKLINIFHQLFILINHWIFFVLFNFIGFGLCCLKIYGPFIHNYYTYLKNIFFFIISPFIILINWISYYIPNTIFLFDYKLFLNVFYEFHKTHLF